MVFLGISYKMLKSASVGTISTFIGLGLSTVLDKRIGREWSNAAGLFLESIIDFFGQRIVFDATKRSTEDLAGKFFVAKVLAIFVTQGLFLGVMWFIGDKVGAIGIQIVRVVTAIVAFFVITYPLRKYWVFKKKHPDDKHPDDKHPDDKHHLVTHASPYHINIGNIQ
jgi:putative flippase GtrA